MQTNHNESTTLHFSGAIETRRHLMFLGGQAAPIQNAQFRTLASLARCLFTKPYGYATSADFDTEIEHFYKRIQRLREEIDAACGAGNGIAVVHSLGRGTYRLEIDPDLIHVEAAIKFFAPHHLSQRDVDALLTYGKICQ